MRNATQVLAAFALSLVLPVIAHAAATTPPGVNLSWDHCFGDGPVMNKAFACDTNTGSQRLVMSFELAAPKSGVSGVEFVASVASASLSLPAWWAFRSAGTCRQTSMTFTTSPPPGSVNCVDWSSGNSVGGIGAYNIGAFGSNTARIVGATAVPPANITNLLAGVEYHFASILINHQKTVGTGSCAGCDVPVCIVLDWAEVTTNEPANDLLLLQPANYSGSRMVGWQSGLVTNFTPPGYSPSSPALLFASRFNCVPHDVTPSRSSTWGAVKSLYR